MITSNKSRVFLVLCLSVCAFTGVWQIRRGGSTLLDHAHRIPNVPPISSSPNSYFWLNANEFLYQQPMQKAGAIQVIRYNIETGDSSVQGALPSGGLQLSPNGQWALSYKAGHDGTLFTIERTDGSRKFLYHSPAKTLPPNLAWTPDDFCLIELLPPSPDRKGTMQLGSLRTYFLNSPTPIASTTVEEDSPALALLGALPSHHALAIDNFHKFASNGELAKSDKIQMLDFPPERDSVALHYTISRPQNAQNRETVLSPQGDRIAWLYGAHHEPIGYSSLHSLYSVIHIKPSYTASVWISKPDGSDLHELGHIPLADAPPVLAGPSWPSNLRWSANGKNVSFLYQNNLYIVPAIPIAAKG